MESVSLQKWLEAAVPPLAFLLILWTLLEPKYSRRVTATAAAGFLAAIPAVQGAALALGQSPELVFTLLPLTFYLPAIVCLHLLSKNRFFPTALIWLMALLCVHLLIALQKLLVFRPSGLSGFAWEWVSAAVLLAAAGLLLLLISRSLRAAFLSCTAELKDGWPPLLVIPVMLLALFSYFLSSTTDVIVLLLLFLTVLTAVWGLARLMTALVSERQAREFRRQMEALRKDREVLQKKLELGRSYRHDMRHHMAVLSAFLQQRDYAGAQQYMADWQGQLAQIETETWCRNAAVNGLLCVYLAQARDIGCTLDVEVSLPDELPFAEVDLCVVLANALENAIHACGRAPEGAPRHIGLSAALADGRRLTIRMENSCRKEVAFDSDGFPVVPRRKGHGQGLRSIAAVAEKYHGLFQCDWSEGVFTLRVALLDAAPEPKRARRAPAVCMGVFLFLFLFNCMPALAQALEAVPVLGQVVRVADLRSYSLGWGSSGISVLDPALEGDGQAVDGIERRKDAFIRQMKEKFIWYASQKYHGYVAEDITYDLVRDDEELFILRFSATINAGSSADYVRYVTLDARSGQVLELADLFLPDSNYLFPISREVKAQMAGQMNAGEAVYFLPGGMWPEEDCFRSIQADQDFYINESGQLVIAFGKYEVAPGSAGTPEFVIPADVLDGLLARPSILK